ncbi:MAG: biotin/lipoyl-containing protein, partial [Cyanobacteria bacterium J06588_5]
MIREVFMPALSSTMTEGKIVSWAKSEGDKVEKGETVVIVESDKADMDVESFYEGYLAIIMTEAGEMAQVNDAIAYLAETKEEIEEAKQKAAAGNNGGASSAPAPAAAPAATPAPAAAAVSTPTPAAASAPSNAPSNASGRVVVSPRARKLAKSLKVDLATVKGSGPHGRVVAADVEQAAGQSPTPSPAQQNAAAVAAVVPGASKASAPAVAPATPAAAPGELVAFNSLQQA